MKICPKCFAEYEDKDVKEDYPCCIECYGDCDDIILQDKKEFLKRLDINDLKMKVAKIAAAGYSDKTKEIVTKRIEKLIREKQN